MTSPLLDTYEQLPFAISHGEGPWVYDNKGEKYLDMYGGHAVALLGHCPKEIIDAITTQAKTLFFYSNIAPLSVRDNGAQKLASILPEGLRHIFFCNSGAEANDNALKLAIRITKREKLVAFKGSFHGRSLLTTAVTDAPKTHTELGNWVQGKVTFLEPNNEADLDSITTGTAAVILEPIQSIGGVTSFTLPYLEKLRAHCTAVGAILIFDEVQTGFGRTGTPFVSGYCGVLPDICTTAKGIGSGYPIGAMFVSDALVSQVKSGDLGSTYGAGPVAMAAVTATVEVLKEKNLCSHVLELDDAFQTLQAIPGVEEIRGKGCLIGLKTKKPAKDLVQGLLQKKIITGTCKDPYVLRLLPPIIITKDHVSHFATALTELLA